MGTEKLNLVITKFKRLFQEENTVHINSMGLSFDFNDDDTSNIHFKWTFPLINLMEFITYLFKFGMLNFVINKVETMINFDSSQITNYKIFQYVLKGLCVFVLFWCCVPLLILVILLRR